MTLFQATGKIKKISILIGFVTIAIIPISYILLRLGYKPHSIFYVTIGAYSLSLYIRLIQLKKNINFPIKHFTKSTLNAILKVVLTSYTLLLTLSYFIDYGIIRAIFITLLSTVIILITIFYLGISSNEKKYFFKMIQSKKHHLFKRK
jgi:hypothetical protein